MPTTTGTPNFRGSSCLFPQSQCTGIALGTRLEEITKRKFDVINENESIKAIENMQGLKVKLLTHNRQ
jgi:TnpA family transposase